jgi:uncharacterized coiled-coil protein SlyX
MEHQLLERLELKIAYLERAGHELSDVVYRQQRELNELRARMQALTLRLAESSHQQQPYTHEEERPPHY